MQIKYGLLFTLILCSFGCIRTIPKPYLTPSGVMRHCEAKYGSWQMIKLEGKNKADGIAVRIDTTDSLILFNKKFRLVNSRTKQENLIDKTSVPSKFQELVYLPSIDIENNSEGRIYTETETGNKLMSFGAFLNIDKIFMLNKWCNHVIVDDLGDGYIFSRYNKRFMGLSYDECKFALQYRILSSNRSYEKLIGTIK